MGVTDHPDWRGFVRQIRENPADDLPRLVAADWLEEHGEPEWAEFVRASVGEPGGAAELDVWESEDFRTASFGLAELPAFRGNPTVYYLGWYTNSATDGRTVMEVRRGFVHAVTCSAAAWVAHGDAVLARQPVERVRLTTWPDGAMGAGPSQGLSDRWPGVEFELPPPLRGQVDWHFTAGAGEDVRAGQLVWRDGDGRVRPFRASVEGVMGADAADEFVTPADDIPDGPITLRLGPDARPPGRVTGRRQT